MDEYQNLLNGELQHKHIVIDFYMQNCKWCYLLQEDWNRIVEDFTAWFGNDKVAFLKIDGSLVPAISRKYNVPYYPYIVYIEPASNGNVASAFNKNPRDYNNLKKWILEFLKEEESVPGVRIPGFRDDV
jgi:hypothetical protein